MSEQNAPQQRDIGGRIKKFSVWVLAILGIVVLATVTGRLSSDSLALVLGIAIGGVPTSLLLVWVISLVISHYQQQRSLPPQQAPPPQYIVPPYAQPYTPQLPDYTVPPQRTRQARDWDIIGE